MGNATLCDAGFYCPMGSSAPAQCIFTTASCPLSGGSSPNQGAVFIILLIFLVVFLLIFRFCGSFLIKWDEQAKWEKVARAVNTTRNHYDTVNEVVLEHNQRIMVKATEDLYQSMVARERAMDSAKHHNRLDDDEVVPINRFSMNLKAHESHRHSTDENSRREGGGGVNGNGDGEGSDDSSDRAPDAYGSGYGVLCSPTMVEPGNIVSPNGVAAGAPSHSFYNAGTSAAATGPMSVGGPLSSAAPMSAGGPMSLGPMSNTHRNGGPMSMSAEGPGGMMRSPAAPLMKRLSMRTRTGKVQREGTRLAKQLQATMEHYQYDDVAIPLTISFRNMSLTLKASGTVVLRNICVSIKPFNVTAIMGPSGAGKTTFLSLLRGQAHYARVTGAMTVNDHPVESLERLKTRTAYVPQDDIVHTRHFAQLECVGHGVAQADVAGGDGEPEQAVARIGKGHQQGQRVVHAGVGIDQQRNAVICHPGIMPMRNARRPRPSAR